jgi:hypothetical protein
MASYDGQVWVYTGENSTPQKAADKLMREIKKIYNVWHKLMYDIGLV